MIGNAATLRAGLCRLTPLRRIFGLRVQQPPRYVCSKQPAAAAAAGPAQLRQFQSSLHPSGMSLCRGCTKRRLLGVSPSVSSGSREASTFDNGDHEAEQDDVSAEGARPPPPKKKAKRQRLDNAVMELHPEYSKNVIQSFIMQGKVLVEGQPALKAGAQVKPGSKVELIAEVPKYVCRAGLKLEAAFERWSEFQVEGKVAMDAGLSTGGFTDCLLQNGAVRVYGVDVGRGQVAEKLRQDPRLIAMEQFNLRHLKADDLPEKVDIVTLDLSFISVLKVIPAVCEVLKPDGQMVVLVKPQFEAGKDKVNTGGVVKDPVVRQEVLESVIAGIVAGGFTNHGVIESPIKGATSGNTEYVAFFTRSAHQQDGDEVTSSEPLPPC